jgi:prepilin-type processing-associated H-X9-DG protein/prepilin-type N-terminal cleavage/methylation domain-containing protein
MRKCRFHASRLGRSQGSTLNDYNSTKHMQWPHVWKLMIEHTRSIRRALSLIEVLVSLSILAVLAGLFLGAVQSARRSAAKAQCQSRIQQLAIAAQSFHATQHHFPQGVWYPLATSQSDIANQHCGISWPSQLLPYLEQGPLWQRIWATHQADPIGNSLEHSAIASVPVAAFRCPSDSRSLGRSISSIPNEPATRSWALTNYIGVGGTAIFGNDGIFHPNYKVPTSSITDGTSSTIMIGERPTGRDGLYNAWYGGWGIQVYLHGQIIPVDVRFANTEPYGESCKSQRSIFHIGRNEDLCHQRHFWSLHPGGANFAFADGSVRFLSYSAVDILPALSTRAGGESVDLP